MPDLIGEKIRLLRTERGMTQQELADIIGVSKNAISLYETSKEYPSLSTLCKLVSVFHVSSDYLLGLTNVREMEFNDLDEAQMGILRQTVHQFEQFNRLRNTKRGGDFSSKD